MSLGEDENVSERVGGDGAHNNMNALDVTELYSLKWLLFHETEKPRCMGRCN